MEEDSNSTQNFDAIETDDIIFLKHFNPLEEKNNYLSSEEKNDNLSVNFDSDSTSSEDLPVLSASPFDIEKLQKNDVVWAEYKNEYWPAVVRSIHKKDRKVSVWYSDTPGISFKLPFKKIHSFGDIEFKRKVESVTQEMSPERKEKHAKCVSLALTFCHRRAIGANDNPALYFDTSKPYFSFLNDQDFISSDKTELRSQLELEGSGSEMSSKRANEAGSSTEKKGVDEMLEEFEDSHSTESSDGESLKEEEEDPQRAKFYAHLDDRSDECDEEMADAIISYIKSGYLDQYLLDIKRGKIKSRNQDIFNQAKKVKRKDVLWNCAPTVNIGNFEKRRDVACYLKELYDRTVKKKKSCQWGEIDYIGTVWLYEAIDKAFSLIKSEPSKFSIPSNAINCPGPSDKEHPSFTEDCNDQNGKKTETESSIPNVDKPEGKKMRRKSSIQKTNPKEATRTKRDFNLRNRVSTSKTLKSSKSFDKIDSDVDYNDSTKCQRKYRPRRKLRKRN